MRGGVAMLCLSNLPEAENTRLIHKEDVGSVLSCMQYKGLLSLILKIFHIEVLKVP